MAKLGRHAFAVIVFTGIALLVGDASAYECARALASSQGDCANFCDGSPTCWYAMADCDSNGRESSVSPSFDAATGICGCEFACNLAPAPGGGGGCSDSECDDECFFGGWAGGECIGNFACECWDWAMLE